MSTRYTSSPLGASMAVAVQLYFTAVRVARTKLKTPFLHLNRILCCLYETRFKSAFDTKG
jgi:hypothetical protein